MGKNRPIKDSEKAELWTRASGGGDGSWIMALSRPGVLLRAKNTTEIPEDLSAKEYSTQYTDKDWTGTAIKTDNGYYPGTQKLLEERLGNNTDFVDTYYRGIVPFESLGMIRKKKAPDRHVLRTAIKEIEDGGRDVKTYQTYRDTLDRNVVSKLDSLMNAGQFELIEKDSDGMNGNTGFRIGDSDIYYDAGGYNTVQITDSDGRIYEKDIDMLDFNPDHWRHKIQFPGAKKALSFLHSQGNPFIVTTPWRDVTVKPDFWKWVDDKYGIFLDENGTLVNPNGLDLMSLENEWNSIPGQVYKKGGRIHIKKKNRGKFTEYCGGKVTEECIAKGKKSKDPKIRKRATFAQNVRSFKHSFGGLLADINYIKGMFNGTNM